MRSTDRTRLRAVGSAAAAAVMVACGQRAPSVPSRDAAPAPAGAIDAGPVPSWRGFPRPFTGALAVTGAEGEDLGAWPLFVAGDRFRVDDPARGISSIVDARSGRMVVVDHRAHEIHERPVPASYAPIVALARTGAPCAEAGDTCHLVGPEPLGGEVLSRWSGTRADGFTKLWLDPALGFPRRLEDADGAVFEVHVRELVAPAEAAFDPAALAREASASAEGPTTCDSAERSLRHVVASAGKGGRDVRLTSAGPGGGAPVDANRFETVWRRDVNGDRRPDLLVREPLLCTPAGTCSVELHVDCGDGTVERVFSAMASDVRVEPRGHGFADLVVTTREREDGCVEVTETRWRLAGRAYEAAGAGIRRDACPKR